MKRPDDDTSRRVTPCPVNAMSVDVEEHFQVSAFAGTVRRSDWDSLPSRVVRNTTRVMDLFDEAGVKATFFTLGIVAQKHPSLVAEIARRGHEVASHGYAHYRVGEQEPPVFLQDILDAKRRLEDCSGQEVRGYRAASFSIDRRTWWAYEALAEAGYTYSSSIHPIQHDHYGVPDAPRVPFVPTRPALVEIPVATVEGPGRRLSCAGGGFFRILPYGFSRWAWRRLNGREGLSGVFYFHPWEIDPDQPRVAGLPLKARLRHYTNLSRMEGKLAQLLREFAWDRVDRVFAAPIAKPAAVQAAAVRAAAHA